MALSFNLAFHFPLKKIKVEYTDTLLNSNLFNQLNRLTERMSSLCWVNYGRHSMAATTINKSGEAFISLIQKKKELISCGLCLLI